MAVVMADSSLLWSAPIRILIKEGGGSLVDDEQSKSQLGIWEIFRNMTSFKGIWRPYLHILRKVLQLMTRHTLSGKAEILDHICLLTRVDQDVSIKC